MPPKKNPYEYDPLPVPPINPQLLAQAPSYWDEVAKFQALDAQRADSESRQFDAQKKRDAAASDQAERAFIEANQGRSIDELIPEIEKIRMQHGDADTILKMREKRADEERQRQSDALRFVGAVGDNLPTEQAISILNSAFGDKYGGIKEFKKKANKPDMGRYTDSEGNPVIIDETGKSAAQLEAELKARGVGKQKKPQSYREQVDEEQAKRMLEAMGVLPGGSSPASPSGPKTSLSQEDLAKAESDRNKTIIITGRRKKK